MKYDLRNTIYEPIYRVAPSDSFQLSHPIFQSSNFSIFQLIYPPK
jgi:hypothetical protein